MMIGVAAAIVVVLGIAAAVLLRKPAPQPGPAPVPTASTNITTTAPASTNTAVPADKGVLLLAASPWGDIDKIVDEKGMQVDLSDDARSTPTRIPLAPGKYTVTMSGPQGHTETRAVEVTAGHKVPLTMDLGSVDFNELEKEIKP
jgi:hypothetical protein